MNGRRRGTWRPAAVVSLTCLLLAAACRREAEVPTYRVFLRDFVHRVTAEGNLRAQTATPIVVPAEVKRMARVTWLAEDGSPVEAGDVVARFDRTEMERRLTDGRIDLETSRFKIRQREVESTAQISQIATNGAVAALELDMAERFQKTDEGVFSRIEIIESQIDGELAAHRKDNAAHMKGLHQDLAATQLALLEIERRKARLDIENAQEGLLALEVRAPHRGILIWTRDWQGEPPQVGDQVWAGQPLGEIPNLEVMEAEVFVLEADAGGVEPGKEAWVTVEAHPDKPYPAVVERVEPVAQRRVRGSPVQYFGVVLRFAETDDVVMKPGHRVSASLLLEERSGVVAVPRQALSYHRGQPRVFIQNGSGFVPRQVRVGPLSASLAVIDEGLSPGDRVALEDPGQSPSSDREPVAASSQPSGALFDG